MPRNSSVYPSRFRRVAVTGLGVVSSIGNGKEAVAQALRAGRSGMAFNAEMESLGFRCCVHAPVPELDTSRVRRSALHGVSAVSIYAIVAALEAVEDSGLSPGELSDSELSARTAVFVGSGGGGASEVPRVEEWRRAGKAAGRLGGLGIPKIMNSTASGHVAVYLSLKGRTGSISAACATGLYNIGHGFELVRRGRQDVCICGAAEEELWRQVGLSADNSAGMPFDYNDRPTEACRPFDRDRQGFVMSSGAGVLVLEDFDRARRRKAHIYAELIGYGAANDGADIFVTSGEGLFRCIEEAMGCAAEYGVQDVEYVNSHGVGTVIGDRVEAAVLRRSVGATPMVSSTKSMNGHAQGAAGSLEAIFTILMLEHEFVSPTKNLQNVAEECKGIRHVQELYEGPLRVAMTVNSGLGGANACLVLRNAR